jgi:CDP-diglyceride synthetase
MSRLTVFAIHPISAFQLLILLTLANGTPVIAKRVFGKVWAQPLDGGAVFLDGRPLFGASKTIRGIVTSIVVTAALAPILGLDWGVGLAVAMTAMSGDLFSSFLKRRMKLPPSSRASGLDQIPESLFPALACRTILGLSAFDIVVVVAIFFAGEVALSRLLFKWGIRERPF